MEAVGCAGQARGGLCTEPREASSQDAARGVVPPQVPSAHLAGCPVLLAACSPSPSPQALGCGHRSRWPRGLPPGSDSSLSLFSSQTPPQVPHMGLHRELSAHSSRGRSLSSRCGQGLRPLRLRGSGVPGLWPRGPASPPSARGASRPPLVSHKDARHGFRLHPAVQAAASQSLTSVTAAETLSPVRPVQGRCEGVDSGAGAAAGPPQASLPARGGLVLALPHPSIASAQGQGPGCRGLWKNRIPFLPSCPSPSPQQGC